MNVGTNPDEEKARIEKSFNCVEAVIKEWLAKYINEDVHEVFDDYCDIHEVLGFEHESKYYTAGVVTMSENLVLVDKALVRASRFAEEACESLKEYVYNVFKAIIASCNDKYKQKFLSLMPLYDEKSYCFYLMRYNIKVMMLQEAITTKRTIHQMMQKNEVTDANKKQINDTLELVDKVIEKTDEKVLDEEEKICREENIKNKSFDKLYIYIDENDPSDEDVINQAISGLPSVGVKYEDPSDESVHDKLEKIIGKDK